MAEFPQDFQTLVFSLQSSNEEGVVVAEVNLSELLMEYQVDQLPQDGFGSIPLDIQAELGIFSCNLVTQAQEGGSHSSTSTSQDHPLLSPASTPPPTSPPRKKSKAPDGAAVASATQRPARSRSRRRCSKKKNNTSDAADSALVGGSRSGSGACQARYERRRQDPKVIGKRSQPILVFDTSNHLLCVRGHQASWIVNKMEQLDKLLQELEISRFDFAVKFWESHGYPAHFDLYFNFCPNLPLKGTRVHTAPHADRKNIAGGMCALMAFHKKKQFNSKLRAWLVIWELGIIIELPVGVLLLYPSALFFHFNVDMAEKEINILHGMMKLREEVVSSGLTKPA
ncbi:hypothetical protein OG21DRAFT_1526429 [Imleria badia]|nr:hypothetical protein OG21DRAFT_1526429 [Imleria badia]